MNKVIKISKNIVPMLSSRSVTHPQIAPGQTRLTSEFFGDRLPKKKLQLIDMDILLILLNLWARVSHMLNHFFPQGNCRHTKFLFTRDVTAYCN